jgi:hypothetical protein
MIINLEEGIKKTNKTIIFESFDYKPLSFRNAGTCLKLRNENFHSYFIGISTERIKT